MSTSEIAPVVGPKAGVPDPRYLLKITGKSKSWRRYCNGNPGIDRDHPHGRIVDRVDLRVVLAASENVRTDKRGWILWNAPGGGQPFSAEPLDPAPNPAEQSSVPS